MAIQKIDQEKCIGCGICVKSCPMDVIRMDEAKKKAIIKYPEECMQCYLCENDCPVDAIEISLYKEGKLVVSWG